MFTIRRFLLFISCSTLLGGCLSPGLLEFRPCGDPGHIGNKTCYYHLTIIKKGTDPIVVAQVSKSVIQQNKENTAKLHWWEFSNFQVDNYPFHQYTFSVASGFNGLVVGQDAWFESVPGKSELNTITVPPQRTP